MEQFNPQSVFNLLNQGPRPSTPRPTGAFRPVLGQAQVSPARPQAQSPHYLNGVRLGPHLLKREPPPPLPEHQVLPIFREKKIPYHELLLQPVRPLDKPAPPPPQEVPEHYTLPLDGVPKRRVKRQPLQIPREPKSNSVVHPDQVPKLPMQPPKNNIMQPQVGLNGDKVFKIVEDKHKSHLHQSMDMMRSVRLNLTNLVANKRENLNLLSFCRTDN